MIILRALTLAALLSIVFGVPVKAENYAPHSNQQANRAEHTAAKANHLVNEKSPYLLQHAYNPVDWYPWGDEAFAKAQKEEKPIFLSVGYSTCHWCHVMERESFTNPEIAALLNRHFVSIKVDREERPDIDRIYMAFVQSTSGRGGWPMTVFMTPDRKPFFGGTYFPPEGRWQRPGFKDILLKISDEWKQDRSLRYKVESALQVASADIAVAN